MTQTTAVTATGRRSYALRPRTSLEFLGSLSGLLSSALYFWAFKGSVLPPLERLEIWTAGHGTALSAVLAGLIAVLLAVDMARHRYELRADRTGGYQESFLWGALEMCQVVLTMTTGILAHDAPERWLGLTPMSHPAHTIFVCATCVLVARVLRAARHVLMRRDQVAMVTNARPHSRQ